MLNYHHNLAWKERLADGREIITHRKGLRRPARACSASYPAR